MYPAKPNRRLAEIRSRVGDRGLIWFGTRGTDALALYALCRPLLVVSQIAPIPEELADGVEQDCLETRAWLRRDLDLYDIDRDISNEATGLRNALLERVNGPIILMAYRAAEMLAAPQFCYPEMIAATNFHLSQRQFEYKPWVEAQIKRFDPSIPMLRWTYLSDKDLNGVRRLLENGPIVGRTATGAGGAGVFKFNSEEQFVERLPPNYDGFVGVAPLLAMATPLNVNACVYSGGGVAVFGVSYQLIGIPGLTRRPFGYSGNDFAAAADLDCEVVDEIERVTQKIGAWLCRLGYLGVFGLDLLLDRGGLVVVEVNGRFQGSTSLSAELSQYQGLPDPMTEHAAAFLHMEPPVLPRVREQVANVGDLAGHTPVSQAVHRNTSTAKLRVVQIDSPPAPGSAAEILAVPSSHVTVEREAMLFKTLHPQRVTTDGYSVSQQVLQVKKLVKTAY